MNTKILETLEFNKIKTLFEPHLLTEQGLEELKGLAPTAKVDKIKQAFTEMEEMQALFVEQPHFTILATRELSAVCKRLEMGATSILRSSCFSNESCLLAESCKVFTTI